MNIESIIFKRTNVNFELLEKYGFKKNNNEYNYSKNFLDNDFKAYIAVNSLGVLSGKIIDLQTNEEYTNIRTEINGSFVNKVREEYKKILLDIKDKCYETNYFISNQANRITEYIKEKYCDIPEFLWKKYEGYGVFRNKSNKKWYAIIMNIDKSKIANSSGEIEIINLKLDPKDINALLNKKGFYKAYHMNSNSWISIILDDSIKDEEIIDLINKSYDIINNKKI